MDCWAMKVLYLPDNFHCPGNLLYRKKTGFIKFIKAFKMRQKTLRNSCQNLTNNKHDYLLVDIWPDIRPDTGYPAKSVSVATLFMI